MYSSAFTHILKKKIAKNDAVKWLKYCRYSIKHYPIIQSIAKKCESSLYRVHLVDLAAVQSTGLRSRS